MSQYLENLPIGQTVDVRGPNGLIEYVGVGLFTSQMDKKSAPFSKQAKEASYNLIKQFNALQIKHLLLFLHFFLF